MSRHDTVVFGLSLDEIGALRRVMDERGYKTVKDLAADLPLMDVEVRDSGNPRRLLGILPHSLVREFMRSGRRGRVHVSTMPEPLRPYQPSDTIEMETFNHATFETGVTQEGRPVLYTETSLDVLMRVPGFRLPGESPRATKERLYRRAYGS